MNSFDNLNNFMGEVVELAEKYSIELLGDNGQLVAQIGDNGNLNGWLGMYLKPKEKGKV